MSERKVKDAIDLETKKNIYFKGHAKATYMSDGTTVEDAINQSMGGESEKLVVSVSGITEGFTVYVMSEDGDVIGSQTTNYKTYRIKEGVRYYVKAGEAVSAIAPKNSETFTAYAYAEREIEMVYEPPKVTTIRIDQNISDPATMITRIVDEGGIEFIRANSHRYTGTFANGVMTLKQLDDNDGVKYLDGSDADLTTLGTDVWMKLPRFYWKCEEHATDVWDFSVVYGAKPDDTYKEWDGKDLIGVYEAYVSSSNSYSVSGVTSTGSVTQANFKTYARNRGEGYTLVKWKHHCMMAMLFYAYYCNTNSQLVCGVGTDSYTKSTGQTNALGMNDTVGNGGNGNTMSINFWGLENWWGNKQEFIDNVVVNGRKWDITEDDGSVRNAGTGGATNGDSSKSLFGANIDLIPVEVRGSSTTGFCDYYYQTNNSSMIAKRSSDYQNNNGGVHYVNVSINGSYSEKSRGSRLAFRGEIVIES